MLEQDNSRTLAALYGESDDSRKKKSSLGIAYWFVDDMDAPIVTPKFPSPDCEAFCDKVTSECRICRVNLNRRIFTPREEKTARIRRNPPS